MVQSCANGDDEGKISNECSKDHVHNGGKHRLLPLIGCIYNGKQTLAYFTGLERRFEAT